jgi:hypothetical protein
LAAIGTAIANTNGLFLGHPSLAYWFWGASFALIAVAIAGWVVNSKRETKHDPPPPTSPVKVRQENKQEFNPSLILNRIFTLVRPTRGLGLLNRTKLQRVSGHF